MGVEAVARKPEASDMQVETERIGKHLLRVALGESPLSRPDNWAKPCTAFMDTAAMYVSSTPWVISKTPGPETFLTILETPGCTYEPDSDVKVENVCNKSALSGISSNPWTPFKF